jgi:WASH complex subunit strumpellin
MNFMGRLMLEILSQTDPRKTTYIEQKSGWFDQNNKEIIGLLQFSILNQSIGVYGLNGMDTLISFTIVKLLKQFLNCNYILLKIVYKTNIIDDEQIKKNLLDSLYKRIYPPSLLVTNISKFYNISITKLSKFFTNLNSIILKIGRAQLVRRHISFELNFSSKLDSNTLSSVLENFNNSLINDIKFYYINNNNKKIKNIENKTNENIDNKLINENITENNNNEIQLHPSDDNPLLYELNKYLESTGMNSPFEKVYITTEPLEHLSLVFFLFVLSQKSRFFYDKSIDSIVKTKKEDEIDGAPLVIGLLTILQQFNFKEKIKFLAFLGQYIRGNFISITKE